MKEPRTLLGTLGVLSSHWLDASSTKGDTSDRGRQIPSLEAIELRYAVAQVNLRTFQLCVHKWTLRSMCRKFMLVHHYKN